MCLTVCYIKGPLCRLRRQGSARFNNLFVFPSVSGHSICAFSHSATRRANYAGKCFTTSFFFLQNRVPPKPNGNMIVEFVDDRGVGAWITADVELPGWGGACHGVMERRAQPALTPGRCRRLDRSVTHAPNPPGARVLACSRVPAQTARLQPRDAPSAGSVF